MRNRPDFSIDGCMNRHDIAERDAFLRSASAQQKHAHTFTNDDLRALTKARETVRAIRIRRAFGKRMSFRKGMLIRMHASVSVHTSPQASRDMLDRLYGLVCGSTRVVIL